MKNIILVLSLILFSLSALSQDIPNFPYRNVSDDIEVITTVVGEDYTTTYNETKNIWSITRNSVATFDIVLVMNDNSTFDRKGLFSMTIYYNEDNSINYVSTKSYVFAGYAILEPFEYIIYDVKFINFTSL
ncbi:MAG TPA: hypothetical protein PKD00_01590 [Burkholderiales bacterium]|nr:hypothetical protein [Burkholderiales bacterium]